MGQHVVLFRSSADLVLVTYMGKHLPSRFFECNKMHVLFHTPAPAQCPLGSSTGHVTNRCLFMVSTETYEQHTNAQQGIYTLPQPLGCLFPPFPETPQLSLKRLVLALNKHGASGHLTRISRNCQCYLVINWIWRRMWQIWAKDGGEGEDRGRERREKREGRKKNPPPPPPPSC